MFFTFVESFKNELFLCSICKSTIFIYPGKTAFNIKVRLKFRQLNLSFIESICTIIPQPSGRCILSIFASLILIVPEVKLAPTLPLCILAHLGFAIKLGHSHGIFGTSHSIVGH